MKQRPAAVLALLGAHESRDLRLKLGLDSAEIVLQQNIFGRDRRVGFELEDPVAIGMLQRQQRRGGAGDRLTESVGLPAGVDGVFRDRRLLVYCAVHERIR